MPSFTLEAAEAKYLAAAGLSAASTDLITPAINGAHLIVAGSEVRVIATDRYRIHAATIPLKGDGDPAEFTISRRQLVWLDKNAYHFLRTDRSRKALVTVTTDGTQVTTTVALDEVRALSYTDLAVGGPFPPVERLIRAARDAETIDPRRTNLAHIAETRRLVRREFAGVPPRLTFVKNGSQPNGALLVTLENYAGVYAEALIASSSVTP